MRKLLNLFFALPLLLLGCGEAGVEVDISKENEIQLSVTNLTANSLSISETVNLAEEEFSEYLDDIESYKINSIEIQINSVSGDAYKFMTTNGFDVIQLRLNGELFMDLISGNTAEWSLLVDAQNNLMATDRIVLYNEENPTSVQVTTNQSVISSLITALENRSEITATIETTEGSFVNANIDMTLFLDLTARTQID